MLSHFAQRAICIPAKVIAVLFLASSGLVVRDTGLVEVPWIVDLVQAHADVLTGWGLYVLPVVTTFPVTMNISTHGFGRVFQMMVMKQENLM